VLISLLMNALDATPPGGHVGVSTCRGEEGEVMLVVSDDGVGIPREIQDKIFNPFFTTKPVGHGTGLGLAICHGIVTSHGGSIRVDSEPGKGARFSALFPETTA
jgi:signal transduction histidine kinase